MKLTKETQDFNNWVLGGAYSRTNLKMSKIREDMALAKKTDGDALPADDPYVRKLEKRKEKFKEERLRPTTQYKSRVPVGSRGVMRSMDAPDLGGTATSAPDGLSGTIGSEKRTPASPFRHQNRASPKRRASPPRDSTPPRAQSPPSTEAAMLRERLKESFAKTAANQVSSSLFPPLLTPYNRTCVYLQRFEGVPSKSVPPEPDLNMKAKHASGPAPIREEFSLARPERTRPQPRSGPMAFVPTANPGAVWRMLARSQYSAQMAPAPQSTSPRLSQGGSRTQQSGASPLDNIMSTDKKSLSQAPGNPKGGSPKKEDKQKQQQQTSQEQQAATEAPGSAAQEQT